MEIKELTERICDYSGIFIDSRKVIKDSVFIAIKGAATDGHLYIKQAIEKGAVVIVHEDDTDCIAQFPQVSFVKVDDTHKYLAPLSGKFYDYPSKKLRLVGITGTNGKTTTVTLLFRMFRKAGYSCGLISTIANYIDDLVIPTKNTTPDILELNSLLNRMCQAGCEFCFMEVSSHAIDQGRIEGLHYTGAIFSNLTHDHLDYHHTFEAYRDCKKRFFDMLPKEAFALVNVDDKNGRVMVQNCKANVYTYARVSPADFTVKIMEHCMDGMELSICGKEVWTKFIGKHNSYNLLAVYATAMLLGAQREQTLTILSSLNTVSGRLEYQRGGDNITAVVDYAHTPDALKNVLTTLQECLPAGGDLLCVVGCGGDRDKSKRAEMAQIATENAQLSIFTADNPRSENPEDIINDMTSGLSPKDRGKYLQITNRKEAIFCAIRMAKPGSIVLVAGKGHETYQEINGVRHHFDDKEVIKEALCCIE